jgi:hypothetical protein
MERRWRKMTEDMGIEKKRKEKLEEMKWTTLRLCYSFGETLVVV